MVVITKTGFGSQLHKEKVLSLLMPIVLNKNLLVKFAIEYYLMLFVSFELSQSVKGKGKGSQFFY